MKIQSPLLTDLLMGADARQQGDISSIGALAKALDVRPQRPLAPVPRLEPVAAQQARTSHT